MVLLQVGHWPLVLTQAGRHWPQNTWPHRVDTRREPGEGIISTSTFKLARYELPLLLIEEKASRQTGHFRDDDGELGFVSPVLPGDREVVVLDGDEDNLTGEPVRSIVISRLDLIADSEAC